MDIDTKMLKMEYTVEILEAMGYQQPQTVIIIDNEVTIGLANDQFKQKYSKPLDLRFHWIRGIVKQYQFIVRWINGIENVVANFFTTALPRIKFNFFCSIKIIKVPFISFDHFQNSKANRTTNFKFNKRGVQN
jgi:hypothetical protein